jgi:hypothetical protein
LDKKNERWTIQKLIERKGKISYPEYQREPNVWGLEKKQRLIDSILRGIDISSIYLFKNDENSYDCVDGRQRLNTILSFRGENPSDLEHNGFRVTVKNEIYEDKGELKEIKDKRFEDLSDSFKKKFEEYGISVVILSNVEEELELNLFFLRLQLGQVLNAGEKLNAMSGEMRDFIFEELKDNQYLQGINVRYRRFAREQIAAQMVINYFSLKKSREYHRARYIDLLQFFKEKAKMDEEDRKLIEKIKDNLGRITQIFDDKLSLIDNKALAVSTFLFASMLIDDSKSTELEDFSEFMEKLIKTIKWQIPQGVNMDEEYIYLALDFYTYVTQAADERYAIEKRAEFLADQFRFFKENGKILRGDKEYQAHNGKSADAVRDNMFPKWKEQFLD